MDPPTSPLDGTISKLQGKLDRLLHLPRGCILPKGVEDEIPLIKRDLEKMVSILSNLQLREQDDSAMIIRCWRKEVRELSYDMEDFVDEYEHSAASATRSLTGSVPRRRQQRNSKAALPWLRQKLRQRLWMANKIREFSVRAQEALQRCSLYNLDATLARSASSTRSTADTSSSSCNFTQCGGGNDYVGISDAMKKLEELMMMMHDEGNQRLKVVSIVGFGGIGKTTLANELYHNIGLHFECRAFVRTSQKPDMRRIFISMLSQVCTHQLPENWTVHSLISTIKTHLQDKRYLIVIEDLRAAPTWDILKLALPDGNCCSRVLTTTEIEDIALHSCGYDSKYVFKMKPLGDDDSRKLFFSSVFSPQHECPPELKEVSYDIIRKCGGLPLAIVTIASIFARQLGIKDKLDCINKSLGYSLITNPTLEGMKQVLDLSYNNLPQNLKACILYTSLYEEDIVIWRDDLVNQWIAEGFISATGEQDKQEISRAYFDELVGRKMIQPVYVKDTGEVLSCVVHHMVLNLITTYKSMEENFVTVIHHSQATTTLADRIRRLSLQYGNADDAMQPKNIRLSQARTLAYFGVFCCLPSIAEFRLLQVLILHLWGDRDSIMLDLTRISELFRLRYLKVSSNVSLELHPHMQGLQSLETLTIDARVKAVPSDIIHLHRLLHLNLLEQTSLPYGIGHMMSLETLGCFDVSTNIMENVHSLGMLTNLRDLQLTYSAVQPEITNDKIQLLLNSILGRLSKLNSLTLVPSVSSHANSLDDAGATRTTLSDGFSNLSCASTILQSLKVSPRICMFFCPPNWIGQLCKLSILKIGVRKIDSNGVDVLGGLPALVVLSLYVQTKPAARIVIGKTGFPSIKYFKFKCCDPFLKFEEDAMPNLHKLKIVFNACNANPLSTMPVGIRHLSDLNEVCAKIGGAGPDDSYRMAAELAFREAAISVHARCQRVKIQCVKQIIGCMGDQTSMTPSEEYESLKQKILDEKDSNEHDEIMPGSEEEVNFDADYSDAGDCDGDDRDSIQQQVGRRPTMDDVLLQIHEGFRLAADLMTELPATQKDPAYLAERCHGIAQAYAAAKRLMQPHHGATDTQLPSPPPLGSWTSSTCSSAGLLPHHQQHNTGRMLEASSFNTTPSDAFGAAGPVRRQQASSSRSSPPVHPRQHRRRRESGKSMTILVPVQRTGNMDHPPDDGYTWHKYGQKDILGSKYPRSYYNCTHKNCYGCEAKKMVRRLDDDPFMYEVIYYGNHTCLTSTTPLLTLPTSTAATSTATATANMVTNSPTGLATAIVASHDLVMAAADEHPAPALSTRDSLMHALMD